MVEKLLVLLNMVLCSFIFYACVCRLKMTSEAVYPSVRLRYVIIATGALCGGFGVWIFAPWTEPLGGVLVGLFLFVLAVAIGFYMDRRDWAKGVPESATIPGALHEGKRASPWLH